MTYRKVRDIIPELISATERGQVKWMMMFEEPNDFYAVLNNHKIEVELKVDSEWDEKQMTICMYLWSTGDKIIDSDYIEEKDPVFHEYYSYYHIIRTNALNVSAILQGIMESLRSDR